MKSPSFFEFQTIIQYLHDELSSCQLQEVFSTEDGLVLGFYRFVREPKAVWLVIDLDVQYPFVGMFSQNPWSKIKKTKPTALFLNSHFKNVHLKEVRFIEKFGRVAEFDFSLPDKKLILEVRMIPKQPNVIVHADDKNVAWAKPMPLAEVSHAESYESENRSIHFLFNQWFDRRAKVKTSSRFNDVNLQSKNQNQNPTPTQNPYDKWVAQRKKDFIKKEKAFQQIDQQIGELLKVPWSKIGDHLKTYGSTNLPLEWIQYIDLNQKNSVNIEKCFIRAKQVVHKIEGANSRKLALQNEMTELQDLSEVKFQHYLDELAVKLNRQGQRKPSEGSFRKLNLEGEFAMHVLMGKNASENLKLLRQAKAWDLWIHLKDYPSAYAILQRPKDKSVSDQNLILASQWLLKESIKNKKNLEGLKISVVIAECRHVRPIKGDKLGRVTYHHPRELLITA